MKTVFLLVITGFILTKANDWGYEGQFGPQSWPISYPNCGGNHQSPINLDNENVVRVYNKRPLKFKKYQKGLQGSFINNGHSMQFNPDDSSQYIMKGGDLNGKYQFLQLHFHWGNNSSQGSEHTVDGFAFPLEMHLVHKKKNGSLQSSDGLAVLGIFFDILDNDYDNQVFDPVQEAAEALANGEEAFEIELFLKDFLDQVENSDYFSYQGSLTTPGCNEVVSWMVMEDPILITEAQLSSLRALTTEHGEFLVDNFRPVQPLNDRTIRKILSNKNLP